MSANVTLGRGWERAQSFNPDGAGRKVILPDARKLKLGGPQFFLLNLHASLGVDVEDAAGGALFTLAAQQGAILSLAANGTLAGTWVWDARSL